ncbi:MAG TPA: hypothetical protein VGU66_08970 [Candidatus Elarobacter sp.]|nr:hypothetical protein [Candidatus Elarobacter sp.]
MRTFGHDREHAIEMAVDAVHVAVSARIHLGVPIPPSDASPQDDLKVVVDVPPAPRSQRVHEAAINSETLVVFPAGEEALPPTVLMHVVRVLKLDVKGVMDMLKCDEEVARELLEGEEPDNAEPPSAGQPAADAGASPQ